MVDLIWVLLAVQLIFIVSSFLQFLFTKSLIWWVDWDSQMKLDKMNETKTHRYNY